MAATTDLKIDQYATFSTAFKWQTKSSGQPVNLTGYTAAMQIRRTPDSSTALVSLSSPSAGITIDALNGRVTVEISAVQTAALTPGKYVYDLLLTNPASKKKRLIEGVVVVDAGVTR